MLVVFLRYNWKEKGHIFKCNKDLHGFWEERVVGPMLPIMCVTMNVSLLSRQKLIPKKKLLFCVCCQRVNGKTRLKVPSLGTHGYCCMLSKVLQV